MGVFNCQGAGWCRVGKKNLIHDEHPGTISGVIRAKDVNYLPRVANDTWTGDTVIFSHLGGMFFITFKIYIKRKTCFNLPNELFVVPIAGEVVFLPEDASIPITLKSREYEVFTVVPVRELYNAVRFAPIGLIKMFNSGGAIKEMNCEKSEEGTTVVLKVCGCGLFGAYSSARPKRITVDSEEMEFGYEEGYGLVTVSLRVPEEELYLWNITIEL